MKAYLVDLDYENYLFDSNYDYYNDFYKKVRESFEFVFFLINKDPKAKLISNISYSPQYLKKLQSYGFCVSPVVRDAKEEVSFWWGVRKDREKEQMLNSKITSAQMAQKNNWGMFNGILSSSVDEIEAHIKNHPKVQNWIIKRPTSFSGIGHSFFSSEKGTREFLNKIVSSDTVLLEPAYNRVLDIGTTFVVENRKIIKMFMVENFNSDKGRFRGARASHSQEEFKKIIKENYDIDLNELENSVKKIAQIYLDLNVDSNIQIDSFFYEEDGQKKLYPLVEVNCRKTMGLVAQSLAEHHRESRFIEWKIFTQKELTDSRLDLSDWRLISPDGLVFKSYYRAY